MTRKNKMSTSEKAEIISNLIILVSFFGMFWLKSYSNIGFLLELTDLKSESDIGIIEVYLKNMRLLLPTLYFGSILISISLTYRITRYICDSSKTRN